MRSIESLVTYKTGTFPDTLGVNSTGPSTKDGTELIANLFNDYVGVFPQALLNEMGMSPSGNAETSAICQQLDAVKGLMARISNGWGVIGRAAADTVHDVTLSVGNVPDSTRDYQLRLTAEITKQIDAAWVAGDNAGGLMGGTHSANTEYGLYLIYNPTTRVLDAGFSVYTGAGVPTFLPAGFTIYQMVDWVKTDGSSNILQRHVYYDGGGNIHYEWDNIVEESDTTIGTTAALLTLTVPTGFNVFSDLSLQHLSGQTGAIRISNPDTVDAAPDATHDSTQSDTVSGNGSRQRFMVRTNTSKQVRIRASLAGQDYALYARGFIWSRWV